MTSLFDDETPQCPQCADPGPLPVFYGAASEEMRTAALLGHIVMLERSPGDPAPGWMCQDPHCGVMF